ncbi:MAG: aminotransferase class I/II-fold pyridoxal phosphate-dependent enzyme [Candidatus Eisenbacteria bacterium]|nr:aminotransferase class I/II-fold pyridoxal phosphate-dependent enzyme [Candidatus Eisenbacteria bacterium]
MNDTLQIEIDRAGREPIYRQLAEAMRASIRERRLAVGARLPATRQLAERLRVHRNTVVQAYQLLEREGWIQSAVGAGTFVRDPRKDAEVPQARGGASAAGTGAAQGMESAETATGDAGNEGPFAWGPLIQNASALRDDPSRWLSPRGLKLPPETIRLTGALADSRRFPLGDFARCMRAVLSEGDPQILEYGAPEGYEPLRAWIADWLTQGGAESLDPARVFIVSGSQQGLDLLGKLFLSPGDRVLCEEPTYTAAFVALRQTGAHLRTVPIDAEGLEVDALDAALAEKAAKFLYMMPSFQNPTGVSLSPARRAALLALARRRRLAIVEDHYDSDLYYWGDRPRPLLADDAHGQVIHLGTFSKMLFPGLRLGWMVVPRELVGPLRQLRWATDLSSAMLTQRAMERFCREGHLVRHLRRLRRVNGRRLRAMLAALERDFPPQARWTKPSGGMMLWCELPAVIDTVELFRAAARSGVLFSPGVAFFPSGGGRNAMRLSFNRESESRIGKGIGILAEMIADRLRDRPMARPDDGDEVPML